MVLVSILLAACTAGAYFYGRSRGTAVAPQPRPSPVAVVAAPKKPFDVDDYKRLFQSTEAITKEQFRERFATLGKKTSRRGGVVEESVVIQAFGKPNRTQTFDMDTYWYWECQDGTIQLIIWAYKNPQMDFQIGAGMLAVMQVNDF